MIGIIFNFGTEMIEVRVKGNVVCFRKGADVQFATIDNLKLDKKGVLKEFPDLKDKDDWMAQARIRFKSKIKELNTEEERVEYIIKDLSKFGYVPRFMQKSGFRPIKL